MKGLMINQYLFTLLLTVPSFSICFAQDDSYPDISQPLDTKVEGLISRLTPEEEVSEMMNSTPAIIPRFHIPAYDKRSNDLRMPRVLKTSLYVK